MTLERFIELTARKMRAEKKQTRAWLDAFTCQIETTVLDDDEKLTIPQFGTFKLRRKAGGVMPGGQRYEPSSRLVFVASKYTKAVRP